MQRLGVAYNIGCRARYQCLSTRCIVHPRVYQNFPGVYRGVPDVCSSRTVTLFHICCLLQGSVLTFHRLLSIGWCALSVFSRLFFCNVGQMTITYSSFFFKCSVREYVGKKYVGTIVLA